MKFEERCGFAAEAEVEAEEQREEQRVNNIGGEESNATPTGQTQENSAHVEVEERTGNGDSRPDNDSRSGGERLLYITVMGALQDAIEDATGPTKDSQEEPQRERREKQQTEVTGNEVLTTSPPVERTSQPPSFSQN